MANDSIELGRIRSKVLRLEDKTEDISYSNSTSSIGGSLNITGNLEFARSPETKILFNSDVNYGSDKAFILYKQDSAYHVNATNENSRLSIGLYNDNETNSGEGLDLQGAASLIFNVGQWDSELNNIIGGQYNNVLPSSPIKFRINNSDVAAFSSNGNFGIGTSSPLAKLSIGAGSLADSNVPVQINAPIGLASYYGANNNGVYGALYGYDSTLGGVVLRAVNSGDDVSLVVNNTTRALNVKSNGNVSIGTTAALEKLHVVGNAIIGTTFNSANGYPSSDLIIHANDATSALGQENAISIFRQQSANSWPQIATMTIGRYELASAAPRTRLDFNLKHSADGTDTAEVNVMSLNSAGRVGIGTASPARQLSVVGQLSVVSGAVGEDTAYNGTIISTKTGSSNQHINLIRAGNHVRSIGYAPNSNTFLIAGGEATDSNFGTNIPFAIDSSGKVGIGTTSPSAKLTVVDNGYPSAFISSSYVSSNKVYTSIQYGATAVNGGGDIGYVYDNAAPANSFFHITPWGQAQGSAFSVKPNKYVGIGTSNPQYPLELNGNVGISGHIYLQTNGDGVSRLYKPANYRLDFNAGTNFWTGMHFAAENGITYDGGITYSYPRTSQFWGYDNSGVSPTFIAYYNYLGSVGSTNPHYFIGSEGAGRFGIFTQATEKLTVLANGNVGINNSNPGDKFGVYENTNAGASLALRNLNAGSSAYSIIQIGNDTAANKLVIFSNSSTRTADGGTGNTTIRTDSGKLFLGAGGTTFHVIDTNNRVGINNTSPSTILDVGGAIKGGRTDTANEGGEIQLARAFDNAVKWTIDAFGSGDGSAFRIFDNTGSVAFYINPVNRYVGLGGNVNFTPTVPLHVKNGNSTYTNPEDNNLPTVFASNTNNASTSAHAILGTRVGGASGGDPFISFDISGVTGWSIGVDNSDSDKFKISNAWNDVGTNTDVTIQTNGNVGIGTASPNARLHVLNNGPAFNLEGTDHVYMQWYPDGTASGRKAYTGFPGSTADYFIIANEIATNGDIILQPGSNADVGINTTAPLADLDINNGSLGTTSGNTLEALRLTSTVSNGSFLRFFLRRHANGSDWNTAATRIQQQIDGVTQGFIEFNHPSNKGGLVIGTDGGVYPLYVNGSYSISATYGYLNSSGLVGTATAATAISIRASDRIMATEFNAVSDARNKEIYSDVELNLKEKFKQLNVTNFIQKSDLGIKKNKGVIAQEVEKIFPDAVSLTTDYVYDIFCLCEKVIKLNEQDYEVTSTKIVDLKIGDEIKIFYKDLIDNINKEKYLLVKNIIDSKTFIVDSGEDITNECVIVGRKVDDFRIVNYQYLNSVTAKMVQDLIVENDYLKNKLEEKDKQINDILSRLAALESK